MKYAIYFSSILVEGILSKYLVINIPISLFVFLYFVKEKDYVFMIGSGLLYDIYFTNIYFLTSFIYYLVYLIIKNDKSIIRLLTSFLLIKTGYYMAYYLLGLIKLSIYKYIITIIISFVVFIPGLVIILILNKKNKHKFNWRKIYG